MFITEYETKDDGPRCEGSSTPTQEEVDWTQVSHSAALSSCLITLQIVTESLIFTMFLVDSTCLKCQKQIGKSTYLLNLESVFTRQNMLKTKKICLQAFQ